MCSYHNCCYFKITNSNKQFCVRTNRESFDQVTIKVTSNRLQGNFVRPI